MLSTLQSLGTIVVPIVILVALLIYSFRTLREYERGVRKE
jgi:heme/copper-type cytochrome/quinol oxidase subunit 2